MLFVLLRSIEMYGKLDSNTEILVYTSSPFAEVIEKSDLMSEKVRFATNDALNDIDESCKARLDLFDLPEVRRYDKILYLDTDIVVTGSVDRVFDAVVDDVLYVLEEGSIDAPEDYWGASLFGAEVDNYPDKSAFTSGIMAFKNSDAMTRLFAAIKDDIRRRPNSFHDQPHIVYNAFKYNLYDNKALKALAVNNATDTESGLVIHHFPGGPGVADHKLDRMRTFLLHKFTNELSRGSALSEGAPRTSHRQSVGQQLLSRSNVSGVMTLPAVPGLLDDYVSLCDHTFRALGILLNQLQWAHLRDVLGDQLAIAYQNSPRSQIVISYEAPPGGLALDYAIHPRWSNDDVYDDWLSSHEPPPSFGAPDSRVWALTSGVTEPASFPILDIGAGTGRNALALARRGHPVDAIELAGRFPAMLLAEAERDSLPVRVIQRESFVTLEGLRRDYRLIVLSAVVAGFRGPDDLRAMFELASQCLAPGGQLVFNTFIGRGGYIPDAAAHQLGQQFFTAIFTREDLAEAARTTPLGLVADDSVHEFEQRHGDPQNWPPNNWYERWVSGHEVFALESPIEMRWLVYRKPEWTSLI